MFEKIGIIGLGLMGGSVGFEIKKRNIANKTIGYSRTLLTMQKAKEKGIIDEYSENPEEIIKNVDFLILATPIGVLESYLKIIKNLRPDVIFTDVSSVKREICKMVLNIIGNNSNFIGSHPIAGSEKSGIDAVKEGLFENKIVVVTPLKNSKKSVLDIISQFWEKMGSCVIEMSPEEHDKILGLTSHLPHFLIYILLYLTSKNKSLIKSCYGSGFLDTTRIGKSQVDMWIEIFYANRDYIFFWIEKYKKEIEKTLDALRKKDIEKLRKIFNKGKEFREKMK